jgi:polyisoprenoid-binding protein YceI
MYRNDLGVLELAGLKGLARALAALALLALGVPFAQAQHCYQLNAQPGDGIELRFSGSIEGTPFRGSFDVFEVRACLAEGGLEGGEIVVNVATDSASVGNRDGNQALRSSDFFFIEQFPMAEWRSTSITAAEEGDLAAGTLTIKSTSADQTVRLQTRVSQDSLQLTGGAEINRLTWAVGVGEFEDPSFIRDRVDLSFDLTLVLEEE